MKKIITISACLLASSIQAATAIDGWYGGVFGGYSFMEGNVSKVINNLSFQGTEYRQGWNAGGRFGYQSNPMRYELEVTYAKADTKDFTVNGIQQTGVSGDSNAIIGLVNVYYDFPDVVPAISPFIGAGIGAASVESRLFSTGPAGPINFSQRTDVFAYQGTAGATYNFAENYAFNLAYRYTATDRADKLGKHFQAHMASLGFVFRFDEYQYK